MKVKLKFDNAGFDDTSYIDISGDIEGSPCVYDPEIGNDDSDPLYLVLNTGDVFECILDDSDESHQLGSIEHIHNSMTLEVVHIREKCTMVSDGEGEEYCEDNSHGDEVTIEGDFDWIIVGSMHKKKE